MNEIAATRASTLYPLYDEPEQSRRYERGEVTHKRIDKMNRKERRALRSRQRKGLTS